MKKLLIVLLICGLGISSSLAAPSLQITSPPVMNNGWTGPTHDPTASHGQWFVDEATREISESRTHEFYDNVGPDFGGGAMSYLAIDGRAQNIQYGGATANNIIAFEISAKITNDTPALPPWQDGSNSHYETLAATDQYEGTLLAPKLTAEFAIADLATRPYGFSDPYRQGFLPHIIAVNEDQLAWYCYTPGSPPQGQSTAIGNYYVPTWDFPDIPQGGSATRILKFTVDGGGLDPTDPRYEALLYNTDLLANRTSSLKISTWIDNLSIDAGSPYPEDPYRGSDVSVFHNVTEANEPNEPNEPVIKWIQMPDITPTGIDICVDKSEGYPRVIADDFPCNTPGLITDVHFWGSWNDDYKGRILNIHLSIHEDIPAENSSTGYSMPGALLWEMDFGENQYVETFYAEVPEFEWWWDPFMEPCVILPQGDTQVWKYDIYIDPNRAFYQTGTTDEPKIYWLDIMVDVDSYTGGQFGWKTRDLQDGHFMDDAVYDRGMGWEELIYPLPDWCYPGSPPHPYAGYSIDMAFAITTTPGIEPNATADLGDAPDSTNTFGVPMTAYPTAVGSQANYPTVFAAGSPPFGPKHLQPKAVAHLGQNVSLEWEADIGPDEDPANNITPPLDIADQDGADDGVLNMPLFLPYCNQTTFDFLVNTITPGVDLYVNVWFDWNRDGDWDDTPVRFDGNIAPEWAVQNQLISGLPIGITQVTSNQFYTYHPGGVSGYGQDIWMRITISEQRWNDGGAGISGFGGSGPALGYALGETEDYIFTPASGCITCRGDLNGDCWITLADMYMLIGMMNAAGPPYQIPPTSPAFNPCADLNGDSWITLADMYMLIGWLNAAGPPYQIPCP